MGAFEDAQIRAVVRGIERATERVVVRLSTNIAANLVETTPRDTGWAAANWVPSIGASTTTSASSRPTSALVSAQQAQQAAAQARLLSYKLGQGQVFISNNVPYIGRLNDGSSAQAPAGFVQAAIRRGISQIGNVL